MGTGVTTLICSPEEITPAYSPGVTWSWQIGCFDNLLDGFVVGHMMRPFRVRQRELSAQGRIDPWRFLRSVHNHPCSSKKQVVDDCDQLTIMKQIFHCRLSRDRRSSKINYWFENERPGYMWSSFRPLVPFSWTHYWAYTHGLSTWSSSRGLSFIRTTKPNLGESFTLRCFQRLSFPNIAIQPCL